MYVSERMKRSTPLGIGLVSVVVAVGICAAACAAEGTGEASGDRATAPSAAAPPSVDAIESERPAVADRLARAPATCTGPAPRLTAFGDYGNLAGIAPVWAGLYATFDRAAQRYRIEAGAPRTPYGWRIKVLWVVGPTLERPARIDARDRRTGATLWFEVGEEGSEPAPFATLDPANRDAPRTSNGYREFPSYVYVPRAGCYAITVDWGNGRRRLVVGLGR